MLHQCQFICKVAVKFGVPHPYDDTVDPKEYTEIFIPITKTVLLSRAPHQLQRCHQICITSKSNIRTYIILVDKKVSVSEIYNNFLCNSNFENYSS